MSTKKSIYSKFGTNKRHETEGVTLDFGDGVKFRVRRAGGSNRAFKASMAEKTRTYMQAISMNTLDEEKSRDILHEVYAETVVISWEGVTDESGEHLEFNVQNFKKVMTDLPDLWDALRTSCDDMRNFQDAQVVADKEQLGKS